MPALNPPPPSPAERRREYFGEYCYRLAIEGKNRVIPGNIMMIAIAMMSMITKGMLAL